MFNKAFERCILRRLHCVPLPNHHPLGSIHLNRPAPLPASLLACVSTHHTRTHSRAPAIPSLPNAPLSHSNGVLRRCLPVILSLKPSHEPPKLACTRSQQLGLLSRFPRLPGLSLRRRQRPKRTHRVIQRGGFVGVNRDRWVRAVRQILRQMATLTVCPSPDRGGRRAVVVKGRRVYGVRGRMVQPRGGVVRVVL